LSGERRSATYRLVGYLMIATASLLFGFNGNLSRLLFDDGISPVTLVELRMLIGGVCLLTVLLVGRRKELKVPRRSLGWICAFGLSLALVTYTYFVSISLLPIAIALVIQFSSAPFLFSQGRLFRSPLLPPTLEVSLSVPQSVPSFQ